MKRERRNILDEILAEPSIPEIEADDTVVDFSQPIVEEPVREELEEELNSALYETAEELIRKMESVNDVFPVVEEKLEEENEMTVKQILSKENFISYEIKESYKDVLTFLANELGTLVEVKEDLPADVFYNKFIAPATKLTEDQKRGILKTYIPSSAVIGQGAGVSTFLVAKVTEKQLGGNSNESLFLWENNVSSVNKWIEANRKFFANTEVTPVLENVDPHTGEKTYTVFITTLTAILAYLGVDIEFLRENRREVTIADVRQTVSGNASLPLNYTIRFTSR